MRDGKMLYPDTTPFDEGLLDVGDSQRICWMLSGNPEGIPVLILHGGPGSGSSAGTRRYFDPQYYRIIQFDQRGCGGSHPHASEPAIALSANTTWHSITDIEQLRLELGVERWIVFGNSWGCTLALIYAETHPHRVEALLLVGVTMTRQSEIDWLYRGLGRFFPQEWARFRAAVPEQDRHGDLVAAYYRRLCDPDPAIHVKAARDWHDWEAASILVDPRATLSPRWSDPRYLTARARIITHYFHHLAWLEDRQILRDIHRLAGIPCTMIQGRLDLEAPVVTAWELSQAWPEADLVIVANAAHSPVVAEMAAAIIRATDGLRSDFKR
ncbi:MULTISPECIES: prolyl aminopeptidase [unclassified Rhizobium]|uniref:prolyl aminopeptidase n=1 Tax=unclassified Rhizobium TaxID=2613769 RepID=UPI000EAA7729|nr:MULTISPECIES: prolyl aminopeptidase [unclassified Rhizobium]AYG66328.1 prolyl aminopeptidase [Rhizobium sp. CCGE531]AYG72709.1 prolyl aminopeptidase [Rhizobium sp. CCGE532]